MSLFSTEKTAKRYFLILNNCLWSPPFEAILVEDNKLHFDSKQLPPIRDLSQIAERFDVNYTLDYSASINKSTSLQELGKIDQSLLQASFMGKLDNHQFFILKQIVGKKNRELNPTREQDEEVTRSRGRGR